MENALREGERGTEEEKGRGSLNPCFNGKCPQRQKKLTVNPSEYLVLILVLMENALREQKIKVIIYQ